MLLSNGFGCSCQARTDDTRINRFTERAEGLYFQGIPRLLPNLCHTFFTLFLLSALAGIFSWRADVPGLPGAPGDQITNATRYRIGRVLQISMGSEYHTFFASFPVSGGPG